MIYMRYVMVYVKGLLMGACDVVPGVSGGTIAFITGIYDTLLDAIHAMDKTTFKCVLQGRWKQAYKRVHGNFLLALFAGVLTAIVLLASFIDYALQAYPVIVWGLFFGLLIASSVIVAAKVQQWKKIYFLMLLVAIGLGYGLTSLPLAQSQPTMISTMGAGMVASMAMILPGISGSYILLMINHYQHIINVLVDVIQGVREAILLIIDGIWQGARFHLGTLPRGMIVVFVGGALLGLILFVRVIHRCKRKYYNRLLVSLLGIMLGALHTVWPWKRVISTYTDRDGHAVPLIQENIIPTDPVSFRWGSASIVLGLVVIATIVWIARMKKA